MTRTLQLHPVVLYTALHRIEGELAMAATARLSDRLNEAKDFLPITNARILSLDGRLLHQSHAVLLNKTHVVMMLERESTSEA